MLEGCQSRCAIYHRCSFQSKQRMLFWAPQPGYIIVFVEFYMCFAIGYMCRGQFIPFYSHLNLACFGPSAYLVTYHFCGVQHVTCNGCMFRGQIIPFYSHQNLACFWAPQPGFISFLWSSTCDLQWICMFRGKIIPFYSHQNLACFGPSAWLHIIFVEFCCACALQ